MSLKNIERLAEAMESGEYHQTRGKLHTRCDGTDYFCAAGLACHLLAEELGLEIKYRELSGSGSSFRVEYNNSGTFVPLQIEEALHPLSVTTLMYSNDRGTDFEQLAVWLRSEIQSFKERGYAD